MQTIIGVCIPSSYNHRISLIFHLSLNQLIDILFVFSLKFMTLKKNTSLQRALQFARTDFPSFLPFHSLLIHPHFRLNKVQDCAISIPPPSLQFPSKKINNNQKHSSYSSRTRITHSFKLRHSPSII